ncbi:MAG: hypothetical protein CL663_08315 [Bacteroidetes bacterium]|nr:hypothetical protein [Bacteroidota bacterium]
MRIIIDIGHPAHVHYFKNFIKIMSKQNHSFLVVSRDKEITFSLLKDYNIPYISRGKGAKGLFGKLLYLIKGDFILLINAIKFKPDLFLSFGSSYAAHAAFIYRKPHISFDDTEHAKIEQLLYVPFTKLIATPKEFKKSFGKKHIRFDSSMDFAYLHSNHFQPDKNILSLINHDKKNEKLYLVRFVSWTASHDKGYSGFTLEGKRKLVSILAKYGKLLISSEGNLPIEFEKYRIQIPPSKIHDLMYYCDLIVGESGSMATEAAILGTPSVVINSSIHHFGVFDRIKKYKSLFTYNDENEAIEKVNEIVNNSNSKNEAIEIARKIERESIDTTKFMIELISQNI